MSEALSILAAHIEKALPGKVTSTAIAYGELNVRAEASAILDVLSFLQGDADCAFINIIDVCGADYPGREKRFDVVYHLLSPKHVRRIRVAVETDERTPVPSATGIFPGALWFEREAYDMYGILFSGHPDLRRLLTDYGFEGHPLRKDFPLTGFVEVRYDDAQKRVVYEPVKLNQEFRNFDFLSPWEGTDYVLPGDEKAKGVKMARFVIALLGLLLLAPVQGFAQSVPDKVRIGDALYAKAVILSYCTSHFRVKPHLVKQFNRALEEDRQSNLNIKKYMNAVKSGKIPDNPSLTRDIEQGYRDKARLEARLADLRRTPCSTWRDLAQRSNSEAKQYLS